METPPSLRSRGKRILESESKLESAQGSEVTPEGAKETVDCMDTVIAPRTNFGHKRMCSSRGQGVCRLQNKRDSRLFPDPISLVFSSKKGAANPDVWIKEYNEFVSSALFASPFCRTGGYPLDAASAEACSCSVFEACSLADIIESVFRVFYNEIDVHSAASAASVCVAFRDAHRVVCGPHRMRNQEDRFRTENERRLPSDFGLRKINWPNLDDRINPSMVNLLTEWVFEVCESYEAKNETFNLTMEYIGTCLSRHPSIEKTNLQLVGSACLYIAHKFEEVEILSAETLIEVSDNAFTKKQLLETEAFVLNECLRFDLRRETRHSFAWRLLQCAKKEWTRSHGGEAADPDMMPFFTEMTWVVDYLCNLSYVICTRSVNSKSVFGSSAFRHVELEGPPSLIAASIVFFAMVLFKHEWTFSLSSVCGYNGDDVELLSRTVYRLFTLCLDRSHCVENNCANITRTFARVWKADVAYARPLKDAALFYNVGFYKKWIWLKSAAPALLHDPNGKNPQRPNGGFKGMWLTKKKATQKQHSRVPRDAVGALKYVYNNGSWEATTRWWYVLQMMGDMLWSTPSVILKSRCTEMMHLDRASVTLVSDLPTYPDIRLSTVQLEEKYATIIIGNSKTVDYCIDTPEMEGVHAAIIVYWSERQELVVRVCGRGAGVFVNGVSTSETLSASATELGSVKNAFLCEFSASNAYDQDLITFVKPTVEERDEDHALAGVVPSFRVKF